MERWWPRVVRACAPVLVLRVPAACALAVRACARVACACCACRCCACPVLRGFVLGAWRACAAFV